MARGTQSLAKLRVEGIRTEGAGAAVDASTTSKPRRWATVTTEAPDVMWGTDMTATVTVVRRGGPSLRVDHCCIGLHAARDHAEALDRSARVNATRIGEGVHIGLSLAHGRRDDFQQDIAFFGIDSPSVREPEGNGVRSASSAR